MRNRILLSLFLGISVVLMCHAFPQRGMEASVGIRNSEEFLPTVLDYVQDGLLAMWDGIDNVGIGVHDDNASHWVELVAGMANFPKPTRAQWKDNCLAFTNCANTYVSTNPGEYNSFVQNVDLNGYAPITEARSNLTMTVEFVYRIQSFSEEFVQQSPYWMIAPLGFLRYTEYNYSIWGIRKDGVIVLNPDSDWYHNRSAVQTYAVNPLGQMHYISFRIDGVSPDTGIFKGDIFYYGTNATVHRPTASRSYSVFRHSNTTQAYTFRLNASGGVIFSLIGDVYCIRIYVRPLTDEEIRYNYLIDRIRFNQP